MARSVRGARFMEKPLCCFSALLTLGLSACGNPPTMQSPIDAGVDSAVASDSGMPQHIYALATTIMANTPQAVSLIFSSASLTDGKIDESKAISVADTVSLFGVEGSGSFYATTAMGTNASRYDVDEHGTITPGPVLGFAQYGLGGGYSTRSIVFISPTKAYLLDDTSLQAISFDPSAMATGKAIDLTMLAKPGWRTNFAYQIPLRGTQVVVTAYHYDANYSFGTGDTGVAFIDSTNDTVTFASDSRCGLFSTVATAANGDLYFGSDTYSLALHRVNDMATPAGCLLRMKAGENQFDPNFMITTTDLTGGAPAGGVVSGDGNSLWLRAFDETLFPVMPTTSALYILSAPAWRWWRVDLANPKSATVSAFPPGAGEVKFWTVAGHAIAGDPNQGYTITTLVDLSADGAPVAGALLDGQPSGIVKVH
jgi:hypothetical protein